ncbi:MAG: COX15/CtaA family protein [Bacteroidota bacterium]
MPGKRFLRLNWITLVFIYLVVIAGSFVRITGSGMGCPDWPRCFGQWVPPTTDANLPENYKDIYSEKRAKKIVRFANFLEKIGFAEEAQQLRNDKSLLVEQDFNARKTWTEYVNRVFGVLAGFGVLFIFIAVWWKYRKRRLMVLATANLVLMLIQGWFGSIVVATNLVPWTITVHMLLALLIILIQIQLIYDIKYRFGEVTIRENFPLEISSAMKWIIWLSFGITFIQMFLGTQVREAIDELTIQGFGRESWTDKLGMPYFIHRSFSWLVLGFLVILAWMNYKNKQYKLVYASFVLLAIELISGVLLAYADMPGLVQTAHLLFACVIFGVLYYTILRMSVKKNYLESH